MAQHHLDMRREMKPTFTKLRKQENLQRWKLEQPDCAEKSQARIELNKHNTYYCHAYARENATIGTKHIMKTDRRKLPQGGIPKGDATSYRQNITYTRRTLMGMQ